ATASSPHNPHLQIPLKLERIWSPEALKEVSMRTFNTAAAGFRITIDAKVLEQFKGDFMCNFTISAASFTAQCIKKLETAKFAGFKRELGEKISDIQIEKVDLADDALIFHLKRENDTSKSAEIEVSLANDMQIVPKQVKAKMEAGESELTIKLPLYAAYPGYPEKLIASRAEYGISCSQVIDGEKYRIVPSQNLADSLSHCEYYEKLNMKLVIAEDWRLTLALRTTHSAEDMGSYNIVRNRYDYYLSPKKVVPKSVLFDVFSGTTVSSSPLAIHNEMIKREGADEYTYNWFVRDYSKILPEKATPVIYESKEYYYALSSSSVYFDTVMQRPWFQKSPGQQICYLAHGYPFKNSGLNFHRTLPNGDLLVENLVKRIKQWDYFLLPAPYGSKLYRDLYDYDGKILEVGYPRNDIFFHADEVSEVRERIRKAYGILDGKKAVLYVPTWRDYKRVEVFKAEKYAALDLHKFAEDLGDEYVILNREHHNTVAKKQNEKEKSAARIIDVSTHPNINDLIIASDMMIGDYSSARFDYSLTKKPIINYVPDIDRYQDGRAFLMPFEDASVGPIIKEQDDLVHSVLTSDQWSSTPEYRAEQDAFFNKYTPLEDGFAAKRVVDALFPEIGERR
ncbi:MAG: CDP-glycerol glycerophosphotransferase family protein, partial [Bifidobacteriaceae bacterium]|nr:CDP-glycerol glycerophosphotransferase family protein [Bifidobacteriaceae bacterium]